MNQQTLPPPFPLCWPEGRARTKNRRSSKFRVEYPTAVKDLQTSLRQLGKPSQVTSDVVGLLTEAPADPGVAVWLKLPTGIRCVCCDEYMTVRENVRAISLTLDALRQVQNYGTTMLDQVLGHSVMSLPATTGTGRTDWFAGCSTESEINQKWRTLAAEHHPDKGGNAETMAEINAARDKALGGIR